MSQTVFNLLLIVFLTRLEISISPCCTLDPLSPFFPHSLIIIKLKYFSQAKLFKSENYVWFLTFGKPLKVKLRILIWLIWPLKVNHLKHYYSGLFSSKCFCIFSLEEQKTPFHLNWANISKTKIGTACKDIIDHVEMLLYRSIKGFFLWL